MQNVSRRIDIEIDVNELKIIENPIKVKILKLLYKVKDVGKGLPQHELKKLLKIPQSTYYYHMKDGGRNEIRSNRMYFRKIPRNGKVSR